MNETFCGYCNRTFKDGRLKCDCGRDTAVMTDVHRSPGIMLLSGIGAATISDPPCDTYSDEDFKKDMGLLLNNVNE